ncbi:flagellin, partial [Campylobacter coli]|nr:flagellin [Campylobacter coli]
MHSILKGSTGADFAINGVTIGAINYEQGDENGALISAINSVKDTTGVEASKDENGRLVLTSRDGRGIKITGNIGTASGIKADQMENYGRLSLVKNDGRDIDISGTNISVAGFASSQHISQSSVSLRESKGQINGQIADAMGFNAVNGGKFIVSSTNGNIADWMSTSGSGFSAGSGYSAGQAAAYSKLLEGNIFVVSGATGTIVSTAYNVSAGSGFSSNSGNSQFATMKLDTLSIKPESAGVTTLKGAMAVMDIVETATINLDQIRADIGSVQNQLQVTINNITVTQVNVKAAESTIRDVDFAAESANFSKYNILAQSGSYAMSQANAVQQNVLKLLQ